MELGLSGRSILKRWRRISPQVRKQLLSLEFFH
jgi:hypothetical protein